MEHTTKIDFLGNLENNVVVGVEILVKHEGITYTHAMEALMVRYNQVLVPIQNTCLEVLELPNIFNPLIILNTIRHWGIIGAPILMISENPAGLRHALTINDWRLYSESINPAERYWSGDTFDPAMHHQDVMEESEEDSELH